MGLQLLLSFLSFFLQTGTTSANFRKHSAFLATIEVIRKKIHKNFNKLRDDLGRYVIRKSGFFAI